MKKMIVLLAVMSAFTAMVPSPASAQLRVNVNIGVQPAWGPAGYDYAEYYFLPDIDMYYCVPTRTYVYYDRGRWLHTRYVPSRYSHYDFYRGYKVVINERDPWRYHDRYRTQYARYRGVHNQVVIRDRHVHATRPNNSWQPRRDGWNDHRDHNRNHSRGNSWNKGRNDDHRGNNGRGNAWNNGNRNRSDKEMDRRHRD